MRKYCIVDKHKELYSILCGDLNVKEIQGRGNIGICVADLVWCIAETNTILLSNYIPIKKKKKKTKPFHFFLKPQLGWQLPAKHFRMKPVGPYSPLTACIITSHFWQVL